MTAQADGGSSNPTMVAVQKCSAKEVPNRACTGNSDTIVTLTLGDTVPADSNAQDLRAAAGHKISFSSAAGIKNPTTAGSPIFKAGISSSWDHWLVLTSSNETNAETVAATNAISTPRFLTVGDSSGKIGKIVTITGTGYTSGGTATVFLDGCGATTAAAEAKANTIRDAADPIITSDATISSGAFTATITVGVRFGTGVCIINAHDHLGNDGNHSASALNDATFTVTGVPPTPTREPTPAPTPTSLPTPTLPPTPTATPIPTPTPTLTPTPTPGPIFGHEFADREIARIQKFIPFRTLRGDLAPLCSDLNQLIATINVPLVARTVDEYLNIIAADYWSGVGLGYSVPTFQGLPAPGLIVGAAETILCLPPPHRLPRTVPTPTAVPTATPTPVPTVSPTAMPIPSPTPAASPVPTPTPGPAATGQIDSLDAQVTALKFFEGPLDLPPGMERAYSQNFNRSDTRYVYWELSLTHPPAGQPQPLVINAAYTRSDGTLYIQHTYSTTVPTNSISTTHGRGSGFSDPGQWSADSYRVDLSVEGVLVATDTFQVTG